MMMNVVNNSYTMIHDLKSKKKYIRRNVSPEHRHRQSRVDQQRCPVPLLLLQGGRIPHGPELPADTLYVRIKFMSSFEKLKLKISSILNAQETNIRFG